jgi:hypothetical protein
MTADLIRISVNLIQKLVDLRQQNNQLITSFVSIVNSEVTI